jgi:hypothetical protein
MDGKTTYVFPGSNTPAGFLSFYREGLRNLENVFILKGGPGCGKSTIIKKIGHNMATRGYDVEFWQCSSDNDSLDGVLIPALSAAVVDGTKPHVVDPQYPGAVDEIINLGQAWNKDLLRRQRRQIIELTDACSSQFAHCYQQLEKITAVLSASRQENSERAAQVCQQEEIPLLEQVFFPPDRQVRHLFSSAITPKGLVRLGEAISRGSRRRFLLLGPYGQGREQLLAAAAKYALEQGHRVDVYHNTLHPESLELLVLPGLNTALLAVDALPAVLREQDIVINCGDFSPEDEASTRQTEQMIDEACVFLCEAKRLHDELEKLYAPAIDFTLVEAAADQLFNQILSLTVREE